MAGHNPEVAMSQSMGYRFLETSVSVDYKGREILKSYHIGVSSHLLPASSKGEPINLWGSPFPRKVAGVVERAALEMR